MSENLRVDIYPAIDLYNGNCVRLKQGSFDCVTNYSSNPVEMAKIFCDLGFKRLHLIDLNGALQNEPIHLNILNEIKRTTTLQVQYGGGIKKLVSAKRAVDCGADRVICGSVAVTDREEYYKIVDSIGRDRVILSLDFKDSLVYINGWKSHYNNNIYDIIEYIGINNINSIICTDIHRDGMLTGTSVDIYRTLVNLYSEIDIIASGGFCSLSEIDSLYDIGVKGVIMGKAYYNGIINNEELRLWLQKG